MLRFRIVQYLLCCGVANLWVVSTFAASTAEHLTIGSVSTVEIGAVNPWAEAVTGIHRKSLDNALGDSQAPHEMLFTNDKVVIAKMVEIISAAEFVKANGGDGSLDLRYRVTLGRVGGNMIIYSDALGSILVGEQMYRYTNPENWLLKVWDLFVGTGPSLYGPFDGH